MYNEIIAALEEAAKDESVITVFTGKTHKKDIDISETCVFKHRLVSESVAWVCKKTT